MAINEWKQRADESEFKVFNFIDGKILNCQGSYMLEKVCPRDGKLIYKFGEGTGGEVDSAVRSAREAFDDGRWRKLTAYQRKTILLRLAQLVEEQGESLAMYDCLDVGKPITHAINIDVTSAVASLKYSAENAGKIFSPLGTDGGVLAYQQRKPLGVVGGIIGWNFPLSLAASKLGPSLAMGNCLVLKPSEYTPLSACRLASLAIEAGVPPGVFNVVNGTGNIVGDTLARHSDVDLLTFVGSTTIGKQLMVSAGQSNMKRLILECGGKSPYIVFDDCPDDLDALAADIVETAFPNQGALCVAGSRLLLHKSIKDKLLPKILEHTKRLIPGDPLSPDTQFGAIINEAHMNKILGYIEGAKKEGAELICGGHQVNRDSGGYYIEPTVFDHVAPDAKIAQEEIFGPVLSVMTFSSEVEAIQLANNSCYGLAAYAATENLGRAQRLIQQLDVGGIAIISTNTLKEGSVELGVEGHKQSGFGMELGMDGLQAYTVSTLANLYV